MQTSLPIWPRKHQNLLPSSSKYEMQLAKWVENKIHTSIIWDQPSNIWSWAACSSRFLLYFQPHLKICCIVSLWSTCKASLLKLICWEVSELNLFNLKRANIINRVQQCTELDFFTRQDILTIKPARVCLVMQQGQQDDHHVESNNIHLLYQMWQDFQVILPSERGPLRIIVHDIKTSKAI